MGLPLGPLLANVFMCLQNSGELPSFYKRFVDDFFSTMPDISSAYSFLSTLNSLNSSVKSTMEIAENNRLPFMGMTIIKVDNALEFEVYRKPTNTGLLLHYHSHVDKRYKKSLLRTMHNHAIRLSSTRSAFLVECQKLRSLFLKLKYPESLIRIAIGKFIERYPGVGSGTENSNKNGDIPITRIVLPYKDQKSADFVRKQPFSLGIKIGHRLQPVFKSSKFENVVRSRESKPVIVGQQCVVYRFKGGLCEADYVGYTSRHFHRHIDKHKNKDYTIARHMKENHNLGTDDISNCFKVLLKCRCKLDCLIFGMLYIREIKPSLNIQSDSIRAKLFI